MISDICVALKHRLLPKRFLTVLAGLFANTHVEFIKNYFISSFIKRFDVNMKEALLESPQDYPTFNDFFARYLKPDVRPIAQSDIICPVDGYVSARGFVERGQLLQAKGRTYTVSELLASQDMHGLFEQGSFVTLYLSPKDYHRIHMPHAATLEQMVHVPGALFSVQPATTRAIPKLFARNERLVVLFETNRGKMAMILVGATIVGAIGTTWQGELTRSFRKQSYDYSKNKMKLDKAAEMGYFKLGSTVILLFENRLAWDESLVEGAPVKMGQPLASWF